MKVKKTLNGKYENYFGMAKCERWMKYKYHWVLWNQIQEERGDVLNKYKWRWEEKISVKIYTIRNDKMDVENGKPRISHLSQDIWENSSFTFTL